MEKLHILQNLLFMNFGNQSYVDYATEHCFAMRTSGAIGRCNRISNITDATYDEINNMLNNFGQFPCTWVIDQADMHIVDYMQKLGLHYKNKVPAMIADLDKLPKFNIAWDIKEGSFLHDLQTWTAIVSKVYNYNQSELFKSIAFLKERGQDSVRIFIGYDNEVPVAASMMIDHFDSVSLHLVSILEEYRYKGLGLAISYVPLMIAHQLGYKKALLTSSHMGHPLALKLGFKEYSQYIIYGNYP